MEEIKLDIEQIIKDAGKRNYCTKYSKPPLGVIPKYIFETQRVQELCRALYEYSYYENSINNYEYMIKWAEELNDRLYNLKFNMEQKINDK